MASKILKRLVTVPENKGGPGKSFFCSALGQYCNQRGLSWEGSDLDVDNQTFSRVLPEEVSLRPLGQEPEDDLIKLWRRVLAGGMSIVDPRAHMKDLVIGTWEMIHFPDTFAEAGGRITACLFPMDDLEVMTDLDATVEALGSRVDYLVVRNRAKIPQTRMFDGSELEADLTKLGAKVLEIPPLLSSARNHLSGLEAKLGRGISLVEAVGNRDLKVDPMVRLIAEDWLKTMFRRLDSLAPLLLPSDMAATINPGVDTTTPTKDAPRRGAKINLKNL